MADVAVRAGVSTTTVSHVLNEVPGKRIRPETRARVRQAAADLGYVVNGLARSLRLQHSPVIGLISDEVLITPFGTGMVLGAVETASRLGWMVMMTNTGVDGAAESAEIRALQQRQVAAFLYVRMYHQHVVIPEALAAYPTVLVDGTCSDARISSVVPDEFGGGVAAAREFLDHGHTRIAFINNADDIPASRERFAGFRAELRSAGINLPPEYLVRETSDSAGGFRAAQRLLNVPSRPEAIFCFNDRVAMGVYQAAHQKGLDIPVDLSVIGFDNQYGVADGLFPGLTTVALPHYEMGAWGVQTLVSQAENSEIAPAQVQLSCPLARRGSVIVPSARVPKSSARTGSRRAKAADDSHREPLFIPDRWQQAPE